MIQIYDCKTEYKKNPMGIDALSPRFSWKIESDSTGVQQLNYQIIVKKEETIIWDSGIVESDETRFIRYEGNPLTSRVAYQWSVRIECQTAPECTKNGREEDKREEVVRENTESENNCFEMGLLEEDDWCAQWIEPMEEFCTVENSAEESVVDTPAHTAEGRKPAPLLRYAFKLSNSHKKIRKARLYQTAHGLYECFLNGKVTSEDKFKPGLTSYYYRIQYQVHDVTKLLTEGENVWSVILGDGWWRGITGGSVINNFGYTLGYYGQLEIEYEDGTVETHHSSERFKCATGALLASDMLMGDIYDARLERMGWMLSGYDDSNWKKSKVLQIPKQNADLDYYEEAISDARVSGLLAKKIASAGSPIREMEQFIPKMLKDQDGALVLDFGQNIAGYVAMTLRDTVPGQKITMTHGETLDFDGRFTTSNIDGTPYPAETFQQITYICKGAKQEFYKPMFAIFGFRYVKLEGYGENMQTQIQENDFTAIAVYSDMGETAEFSCSNPLLNQLFSNCKRSQKGNFMDVPVDCPTRERNAWTGDAQIYARTAGTLMNAYPFYEKWLKDQTIEQYESGKVGITFPSTSSVHQPKEVEGMKHINPLYEIAGPSGNGNIGEDSAGWGDAAVWIPYIMYQCFGDKQILENQYETARKWLEYELTCAKEHNPCYEAEPQYQNVSDGELDADYIWDTKFHYGEWNEANGLLESISKAKEAWKQKKTTQGMPKTKEQVLEEKQAMATAVTQFIRYMAMKGNPVTATAYMARSAENVADMASVLGKDEDAVKYTQIAKRIRSVYEKYLIGENGEMEQGHQAPYVRALWMNLCGAKKSKVLEQLIKEIAANDYHLNTGFLSTPFLLPVLCENGYSDIAYRVLENEELPGWLFPVRRGLTTIPESWAGTETLKDSLNHYSYGAVSDFLIRYISGIKELTPGYRKIVIQPVVGGSLTHAETEFESPCGRIVSKWKKDGDTIRYHIEIPVNVTAHIRLDGQSEMIVGSGSYDYRVPNISLEN